MKDRQSQATEKLVDTARHVLKSSKQAALSTLKELSELITLKFSPGVNGL